MNDRHPSGAQAPAVPSPDASYGHYPAYGSTAPYAQHYGDHPSYGPQDSPSGYAAYGEGDQLYSTPAGTYETNGYGTSGYGTTGYAADSYDTSSYGAGADAYGGGTGPYDTGAYATGAGQRQAGGYDGRDGYDDPYAHTAYDISGCPTASYDVAALTGHDATAMWPVTGHDPAPGIPAQASAPRGESGYPHGAAWEGTAPHDTHGGGPWEATAQWDLSSYGAYEADPHGASQHAAHGAGAQDVSGHLAETQTAMVLTFPADGGSGDGDSGGAGGDPGDAHRATATGADTGSGTHAGAHADSHADTAEATVTGAGSASVAGSRAGGRNRGRGRRTVKRSALLTVAVPSVAAMGVCAVAAASVSGIGKGTDGRTTQATKEVPPVKPAAANRKLDTQLASLSAGADDFADRASRTQERIDLKARQAADRKRRAEEAARKEAERPKFLLPVKQHGLSAYYGQAGVNWMSVHTGIDFPVSYGTPVMAATDGTVRTQWNSAYGNMAIVTAPDGTETWYCHLSSTRIRSGQVKAGDQIAYSGNSGNSTGPHLHFEVRPGGGSPIDPLPWLRSHGLDPN
ncbi:M23 family metallopeptidase [Streptomyces sp. MST-110588]|uniref:M23 family metallopeptidase n=1 Tax=Streptomyces sp. MST-110588 TaxID=2833628 RepID=UPI001F5C393B|nr:M23 family metallopeptidase [Streptomyces sp. MST-110588]UNO40332.1 M23 family metallopeptidase [Streptomyces sp. MST-110588]